MSALFDLPPNNQTLPYDGDIEYIHNFLSIEESTHYFEEVLTTTYWSLDTLTIAGKQIVSNRKTAWYGKEPFNYTYSGQLHIALPWNETIEKLHQKIEQTTNQSFNSCLLNLYENGSQGMGWHSDNEPELNPFSPIASLSLGTERHFDFKHKTTAEKIRLSLGNGSLLVMHPPTQKFWLHQIPKSSTIHTQRINLTFRNCII